MLIVLKGADFSANKIGTVAIPRESLDVTTSSILSKYTKSLSVDKQYAFDDLIIALKANGLWSKIVYAYFPCLANSIAEALYEAKGSIPITGVANAGSVITTGYQLENYGLKTRAWTTGDGYSIVMPKYTYGINTNSLFIASLFRKDATTSKYLGGLSGQIYIVPPKGYLMGSASSGMTKTSTAVTPANGSYNVLIVNTRTPGNSQEFLDISLNGTLESTSGNIGTTYVNPNIVINTPLIATSGYEQYHYNTWPVAVQLFGNELTASEIVELNSLLQNFNEKIV